MALILQNAQIVTQNAQRKILQGDLLIEGNRIRQIAESIPAANHEVFDLSGLTVIPGFIQSHIHVCQTLFRNLADDLELLDWLEKRIWPFEMAHTPDSLRAAVQLGLAETMLAGTTSILDMGNAQYQDVIFEEMINSGIRGFSGKVMMDSGEQPYKESTNAALKSSEQLIQNWHFKKSDRVGYALAPRFVPSCSDALLKGVNELAKEYNLIIHTHSSENKKEWQLVKQKSGYSNVELFVEMNLASPQLCLAHCIWISNAELKMLAENGIKVLHCPTANLKLGSGIAPLPRLLSGGVHVGLGSDGAACNNNLSIFNEMRLAALIQKPVAGVTAVTAKHVFDMATLGGASVLGLAAEIGSIEVGKKADFTILDLNKVHSVPADNIYSQIVYSATSANVKHVMIDGKWIVLDQSLVNYDHQKIISNAWEQIQKLIERLK